jgi:hypothetical protein
MQHSFDISIATKYGVNVAIFLNNIAFWIHKNVANNKHYHDGFHWTYNSQEAFLQLFPYWTRQNLRTVINQTREKGLILIGCYNETKYDHTSWYALTDEGLSLFPTLKSAGCNQPINLSNPTSSLVGINQPIPDSNTDIKPNREQTRKKRVSLPDNFKPKAETQKIALDKGIDPERTLSKFKSHAKSEGWKKLDWDEAYLKWVLDEKIEKKISYSASNKIINEPQRPRLRDFTQERLDREERQRQQV